MRYGADTALRNCMSETAESLARQNGLAAIADTMAAAPADRKASLRAAALERAERPTWRSLLREAFAPKPWAFGAASAFAAALVVLALRHDKPVAPPPPVAVEAMPDWRAASAELSAELWTDDDGGDHDEA